MEAIPPSIPVISWTGAEFSVTFEANNIRSLRNLVTEADKPCIPRVTNSVIPSYIRNMKYMA